MSDSKLAEMIEALESHGPFNVMIPTHELLELVLDARAARAEAEQMRAVAEAAARWTDTYADPSAKNEDTWEAESQLYRAVKAALTTPDGEGEQHE